MSTRTNKKNETAPAKPLEIPVEIVRAAREVPLMGAGVFLKSTRREALVCDGKVVGFVTPHETSSGWRHGPIFVLPEYRGRGLVEAYYASHPERLCVAFIPAEGFEASKKMHEAAGFVFWKNAAKGVFLRRMPIVQPATSKGKNRAKK